MFISLKKTEVETKEATPETETKEAEATEMDIDAPTERKMDELSEKEKVQQNTIEKLTTILSGEKSIYSHLQFLIRNDKSDMLILKQTKDAVRVSVCHFATVVANGFMHCGTTHDAFLR